MPMFGPGTTTLRDRGPKNGVPGYIYPNYHWFARVVTDGWGFAAGSGSAAGWGNAAGLNSTEGLAFAAGVEHAPGEAGYPC